MCSSDLNIADFKIPIVDDTQSSNPNGRIEFVLLKQQKQLLELDLLNQKANYLPTLAGFATYGQTNQVSDFSDAFDKEWWFPTGVVGARLSIPIFTGFQNRYKVQKSQISIQKTENQLKTAERSFSLQFNQAQIALKNAIATLESKKSTMELSEKVYQSIVKKYKNGTTDVLAVTSSYTDFRTAETAYLEGVYDVVMAKLELDIASGKLKY